MTILKKLHAIEKARTVCDIHYCRAGVGFLCLRTATDGPAWTPTVQRYYPSFEKAVESEYIAIQKKTTAKKSEKHTKKY